MFETIAGAADLYGALSVTLQQPLPGVSAVSWIGGSTRAFSASILLVVLPLCFPTGRPPTPRWRWVGWLGATGTVLLLISTAYVAIFIPELMSLEWEVIEARTRDVQWLFTMSDLGFPLLMAAGPLAVLSLIVRFTRSRGVERQQIKLLAYPSRTLTYALLSLFLVGVYLAGVTTLTAVTAPLAPESPLAVAAATLLAAAAFQPARRRIQSVVDRRFNRARYDARRTIDAFAASPRQQADIDDVHSHLITTVAGILSPREVRVWLRPRSTA